MLIVKKLAVPKRRNSGPGRNFVLKFAKYSATEFLVKNYKVHLVENLILYTMLCVNLQNSYSFEFRKPNFVN
jgi:hypothetical protein